VIEQLKFPLLNIARQAELAQTIQGADYKNINSVADMALKIIDSYLMSIEGSGQAILELEPVSLSSILNDVADSLSDIAKIYNCTVELKLDGKFVPVMGAKTKLEAAFTMLGYSYIEASAANTEDSKLGTILLSGYKTARGLTAGVFSPSIELTSCSFNRALKSFGHARQSLPEISQATAVGIFIADGLLDSFAARLRVAHHRNLSGLATTLIPSKQLQLLS